MTNEEIAAKLQEIEDAERVEREKEAARANASRIARHELKKKYEASTGGEELKADDEGDWIMREGVAFAIVETPRGFVVLKKAAPILYHKLTKSKMSDPDIEEFIRSIVVEPDWQDVAKTLTDFKGAQNYLLDAGCALYGTQIKERSKK